MNAHDLAIKHLKKAGLEVSPSGQIHFSDMDKAQEVLDSDAYTEELVELQIKAALPLLPKDISGPGPKFKDSGWKPFDNGLPSFTREWRYQVGDVFKLVTFRAAVNENELHVSVRADDESKDKTVPLFSNVTGLLDGKATLVADVPSLMAWAVKFLEGEGSASPQNKNTLAKPKGAVKNVAVEYDEGDKRSGGYIAVTCQIGKAAVRFYNAIESDGESAEEVVEVDGKKVKFDTYPEFGAPHYNQGTAAVKRFDKQSSSLCTEAIQDWLKS